MRRLLRNTGLYTLGNVLPQAIGFILLPVYTRFLTPEQFGIVGSMQTLSVILALTLTLAVDRAVYRLYWDHKTSEAKKTYLGTMLVSLIFVATCVLALLFIGRDVVALSFRSIGFFPYFAYAILAAYFMTFGLLPKTRLQLEQRAGAFVALTGLQFLLTTSAVLYFVVVQREGAAGMLKGQMLGNAAMAPVYLVSMRKAVRFRFRVNYLRDSLKFSLPMIPALLSSWVLNLCDRIFIERYFTLREVGLYSLSFRIATIVLVVTGALSKAYHPVFYQRANAQDQNSAQRQVARLNNLFVLGALVLVFLVSFFAREFVVLFLDPKFGSAHAIVPLIALSYFVATWLGLLNLSVYQTKKTMIVAAFQLSGAAITLALNFWLVPQFGPYGAACARLIALSAIFAALYPYSRKCYKVQYNWGTIALVGFGLAGIYAAFGIVKVDIVASLVLKIFTVFTLAAIAWLTFGKKMSAMASAEE